MGRLKKIALTVYLLAGIVVVGGFAGLMFGPFTSRFAEVFQKPVPRILLAVSLFIVCIHMLTTVVRMLADRPAPDCVHPNGAPDIEVSTAALASVARVAAADRDLMIEDVSARVSGHDRELVTIKLELIAFTDQGLEGLAHRIQQRVTDACESMLGTSGVRVQVRFLPSKTEIVTKEVSGE